MKYLYASVLLTNILSCTFQKTSKSLNNCFYISQYPEFKFGEPVDTSRIPFPFMEFEVTEREIREDHLPPNSTGYMYFDYDEGMSTLIFTIGKSDKKLNSITASWTIYSNPKSHFLDLKETYLPCIPVEALLRNPNKPVEDKSSGISEFYQYSNNYSPGIEALHYWVGIQY